EYAILMKRVPQESLLKYKLLKGELSVDELERISRHIAEFHLSLKGSEEISHFGRPEVFRINTDENFSQTEPYIGKTIGREAWEYLREWTERFYEINRDLFFERINAQRIKDCHGDLHMEHIALMGDMVVILDCIEFNHRFRYGDTLNDIAFLIMDMEYNGLEKASKLIWDFYSRFAKEEGSGKLLTFYKVYRAYVRGKVTSFLLEGSLREEEKEIVSERAKRYFEIALSYAQGIPP
ncbi:MAG: gluconokinase, partial [Desulfatiglandales bacterium]